MAQIPLFEGPQLLWQNKRLWDEVEGGATCSVPALLVPIKVTRRATRKVFGYFSPSLFKFSW